jgi:DNA-binding NarL/FixJ family response regulator
MHTTENYVLQALKNNVAAYVSKDSASTTLIQAIEAAVAGKRYLPPPFSEAAIAAYINQASGSGLDAYGTLTTREREVLQLVAEGHTNGEIGARLFISSRTVESHRAHLMQKLMLRNEVDLVRYAIRKGLLPNEGDSLGKDSIPPTDE